ncbi:Uma2 family endonuclease [Oscillatoria sp. FACHB-1406]|uniref:Uma2 family endonuclease n=1 Tax=Oscillatoria sp. FACHB-1406 TaxID=2692846 RepID=UPI001683091C|nr:Uma2 family endonuclease [Oscillatoria sp. FACHB-1406]
MVPDGFLSLGVERHKNGGSRPSYPVWEENGVVPILALEVVSWTPGEEYNAKAEQYAALGVLYYVVYNPQFWQRDRHLPFEVYRLRNGRYELQIGEPYWMPEIGLGIGRYVEPNSPIQRELLGWFDEKGQRYQRPEELLLSARQEAERERERAEQIKQGAIAQLLNLGLTREQVAETLGLSPDEL